MADLEASSHKDTSDVSSPLPFACPLNSAPYLVSVLNAFANLRIIATNSNHLPHPPRRETT
jgi:hypothetical protein